MKKPEYATPNETDGSLLYWGANIPKLYSPLITISLIG